MIKDTYQTVAEPSYGEYKEKGSKFMGFAYFVEDEQAIKDHLEELRKEHFKARHHCYAWRLGMGEDRYRANDDGEPSGTGGWPILGQIDSFCLRNVLIVVLRYYGGTKLGASGLKNAYKTAAMDALQQATIEERILEDQFELTIDYSLHSDVMQYLNSIELTILDTKYTAKEACFKLSIRKKMIPEIAAYVEEHWAEAELEPVQEESL